MLEDFLALVVLDVVEFQKVLADVEVAGFDLLLRLLQRLVDPGMDDGLAILEAEPRQHAVEPVGPEDPHQIVFQRQEELRTPGVALTAGTAAQLVVDAPRFMALRADDVEAAGPGHGLGGLRALCRLDLDHVFRLQHNVAEVLDVGLDLLDLGGLLGCIGNVGGLLLDPHLERAAELDVGAAAGHVGRDRDRAGHARLGHDVGFLLVEARIQHREQFCRLARARRGVPISASNFRCRNRSACSHASSDIRRSPRISRSRRCRPAPAAAAHWRARSRPESPHISRSGCDRPSSSSSRRATGRLVGISTTSSL